jgi:hypothetical protein
MTKKELRDQVQKLVSEIYPETPFACLSIDVAEGQLTLNVTPPKAAQPEEKL